MQTFQDSETGQFWQFDDNVLVTGMDGERYFNAPHGAALNVPPTLMPAEMPHLPKLESIVPQVVSRFQGREAMWRTPHNGATLFEAAEALIARPDTPAMYRRAWVDLQEFRRDSEMLRGIAMQLGLSGEQVDSLFILAASIQA